MKNFIKIFSVFLIVLNLNAYEVYKDRDSNLTIETILNLKFETRDSLNFGATDSTIWIKFNLINSENRDIDKFLHVNMPFLESVNLYEIDKEIKVTKNGNSIPIDDKEIKTHHNIFKVPLLANETKEIYLRVESKTSKFIVTSFLESEEDAISFIANYNSFIVSCLAILAVLFIYNLFIYLYLKERVYFYYILYIGSFLLQQLLYTSFIFNYIHIHNYFYMLYISSIISIIFAVLFARSILETKKYLKVWDRVLLGFIALLILEFFVLFINEQLQVKLMSLSSMTLSFLVFVVAIAAIRAGVKVAKPFLFAWSVFLGSLLLTGLFITKIIPAHFLLSNALQIGSLTEITLFSLILAYRIHLLKEDKLKAIDEIRIKDKVLNTQSKFATIGETLCNIEHQWRSPLSQLSAKTSELDAHIRYAGVPNKVFLESFIKHNNETLEYMSGLVSDFRNFYTPNSKIVKFQVKESILSAINLIEYYTKKEAIEIAFDVEENPSTYGYPNEFTQVILNLLSNAKDIFIERKIQNPKIEIDIKVIRDKIEVRVIDNGGGIDSEIVDKIFDPFFSSKDEKSSGIGLYMSKVIIKDRMGGDIRVKKEKDKTIFKIILESI